ncbi:hypothetical protein D3C77_407690 [compost metagenome]
MNFIQSLYQGYLPFRNFSFCGISNYDYLFKVPALLDDLLNFRIVWRGANDSQAHMLCVRVKRVSQRIPMNSWLIHLCTVAQLRPDDEHRLFFRQRQVAAVITHKRHTVLGYAAQQRLALFHRSKRDAE